MKRWLWLFALLPASAFASNWTIDYDNSSLTFEAKQGEQKIQGQFGKFSVDVSLNPAAPEQGKISVNVDLRTAGAGSQERNQALPQREWFDVANFPVATFESTRIRKTETGFEAVGHLTLKGVTEEVSIPFTLTPDDKGKTRAQGSFTLQRDHFKVGIGEWDSEQWIAFSVVITFNLLATP